MLVTMKLFGFPVLLMFRLLLTYFLAVLVILSCTDNVQNSGNRIFWVSIFRPLNLLAFQKRSQIEAECRSFRWGLMLRGPSSPVREPQKYSIIRFWTFSSKELNSMWKLIILQWHITSRLAKGASSITVINQSGPAHDDVRHQFIDGQFCKGS